MTRAFCQGDGCTVMLDGRGVTGLCRSHAQQRVQAARHAGLYASADWQKRVRVCAGCGSDLKPARWRMGDRCKTCTLKSDERRAHMAEQARAYFADPAHRAQQSRAMLARSEGRLRVMLPWCPPPYRPLYRELTRHKRLSAADARRIVEGVMRDEAAAASKASCPLLLFAKVREARRWLMMGAPDTPTTPHHASTKGDRHADG